MKDLLLDAFKLGLGAVDLTQSQAEKLVDKARKRYPQEFKDGRKMVDDFVAEAKKQTKKLRKDMEKELDQQMKKQTIVKEKDLKELHRHVKNAAKVTLRIASDATKPKKKKTARKKTTRKKAVKKRVVRKTAQRRTVKKKTVSRKRTKR